MVNFVCKIAPDLICVYLIFRGGKLEDKVASLQIRHYLDKLRNREDVSIAGLSETGLLRLNKLINGSVSSFVGTAIAGVGVLFSLISLAGSLGAALGLSAFIVSLTNTHLVWMGTSLDTVQKTLRRQKFILIVFTVISIGLKIYEALMSSP